MVGSVFKPSKEVVEVLDVDRTKKPLPSTWIIVKTLTPHEVATSTFILSSNETFEHIFRYWPVADIKLVLDGHKIQHMVEDVVNSNGMVKTPVIFEMIPNEEDYGLVCRSLFEYQKLEVGDEIGLLWDYNKDVFRFIIFRRVSV